MDYQTVNNSVFMTDFVTVKASWRSWIFLQRTISVTSKIFDVIVRDLYVKVQKYALLLERVGGIKFYFQS